MSDPFVKADQHDEAILMALISQHGNSRDAMLALNQYAASAMGEKLDLEALVRRLAEALDEVANCGTYALITGHRQRVNHVLSDPDVRRIRGDS